MQLITDGDLVVGRASGAFDGIDCPDALAGLPIDDLRVRDGEVIDARQIKSWFIDGMSRKHIVSGEGWQPLTCALGDVPERGSDGTWGVAPPPTVSQLAGTLMAACSTACDAITAQVIPDATHQQAYDKAAMAVMANGGAPPTADPFKTVFADLGASVGIADPATFAKVVMAVSLASMQLATVLSALKGAAASAKSAKALATALSTFEATIGTFVEGLNGEGLTAPIAAPAPIVIAGING